MINTNFKTSISREGQAKINIDQYFVMQLILHIFNPLFLLLKHETIIEDERNLLPI